MHDPDFSKIDSSSLRHTIAGGMAMPSIGGGAPPSKAVESKWESDISAAMFGKKAASSAKAAITAGPDGEVPEAAAATDGADGE